MATVVKEREIGNLLQERKSEGLPPVPPEPYVVEKNGEEKKLTLTEALHRVADFERGRKEDLSRKVTEVAEPRGGSPYPPSKREQREIRESLRGEIRKTPNALTYPLILCVLMSPLDKPFQIFPGLSPLSEKFPAEGELAKGHFYRFICNRPVEKAIGILNRSQDLETLWNFFSYRLELQQKVFDGVISSSKAIDEIFEFNQKIDFPKDLNPFVREISEFIPLDRKTNSHRRF